MYFLKQSPLTTFEGGNMKKGLVVEPSISKAKESS